MIKYKKTYKLLILFLLIKFLGSIPNLDNDIRLIATQPLIIKNLERGISKLFQRL